MSTLSETLTFGLILLLLVGSVCLYLYTRIQQVEQKLSLVESILLELKMTSEFKNYNVIGNNIENGAEEGGAEEGLMSSGVTINQANVQEFSKVLPVPEQHIAQPLYTPLQDNETDVIQESVDDGVAGLLSLSGNSVEKTDSTCNVADTESSLPSYSYTAMPEEVKQSTPLVSINYESMTLKELKAIADQRNITGISGMKRSQLIGLLNDNVIKE